MQETIELSCSNLTHSIACRPGVKTKKVQDYIAGVFARASKQSLDHFLHHACPTKVLQGRCQDNGQWEAMG